MKYNDNPIPPLDSQLQHQPNYLQRQINLMMRLRQNLNLNTGEEAPILAVIEAGDAPVRSLDVDYDFHSNPNFLYLTGFPEPQATLLLLLRGDVLYRLFFCRPKNPERELWDGKRIGVDAALEMLLAQKIDTDIDAGIDATKESQSHQNIKEIITLCFSNEQLPHILETAILQSQYIFSEGLTSETVNHSNHNPSAVSILQQISIKIYKQLRPSKALHYFSDLRPSLHCMRLIKDAYEIATMKKAAEIAVGGHIAAIKAARVGIKEAQLAAVLAHHFSMEGAEHLAYPSIVATGENSCILHHRASQSELKAGDLVLIDAGCEYLGYAADITRTFPANGRFTEAQKKIYQIVDDAHQAAIKAAVAGAPFSAPHHAALRVIILGLVHLGLLQGGDSNPNPNATSSDETIIQYHLELAKKEPTHPNVYTQFFMHRTSHYLGMDVHDVGSYQQGAATADFLKKNLEQHGLDYFAQPMQNIWQAIRNNHQEALLENGMVITIEPGIYIRPQDHIDQAFWHIGIRLENDILIDGNQAINLTAALPMDWQAIEALNANLPLP